MATNTARVMRTRTWNVYLNNVHIDTVKYPFNMTKEQVETSLVYHDGFSPNIRIEED